MVAGVSQLIHDLFVHDICESGQCLHELIGAVLFDALDSTLNLATVTLPLVCSRGQSPH